MILPMFVLHLNQSITLGQEVHIICVIPLLNDNILRSVKLNDQVLYNEANWTAKFIFHGLFLCFANVAAVSLER